MPASLAANSAVPAGLRKRPAFDADFEPKGHAAGILFVAPDGNVLLLKRAGEQGKDNFVGHWALPGGGVEADEMPAHGAMREAREEMGVDVNPASLRELDKSATPNGLAFHTYAARAPAKFRPILNDEHEGYGWFPLDRLPDPLHPAVARTLKERVGVAEDMTPEEWNGLRDGFLKWTAEEEAEKDHAEDELMATDPPVSEKQRRAMYAAAEGRSNLGIPKEVGEEFVGATDSAPDSRMEIAMDRDSVREKTRDGRLIVKRTPITKANVCPYLGEEIPGWEKLGLEPKRVYNLLRDPEEIAKGAATSNGVQVLRKHVPVKADDHRPMETVGSLGTDADFDGDYLYNSMFVNAQDSIDGIETNRQREISAGYHYTPDMTPGNFRGSPYDGVMRDIVFNHVALVEDGRAGPDVVVGDEALKEQDMAKATRFGAMTLAFTAAQVAPLLAMDSKAKLSTAIFAPLTTKNFKNNREKLLGSVRNAIDGKLRKGLALDASMEQLSKALDAFSDDMVEGIDEPAPEEKAEIMEKAAEVAPEPPKAIAEPGSTYDAEPMKAFLREKGMGEDDIAKVCDMMPKAPIASDEEDEEAKKKAEAEKQAKDNEMKDMVSKPAMDAAINAAVAEVRKTERAIRTALSEVKPYIGELPAAMAFDSAADVYRHVLSVKGVDGAKDLHADALLPILKTLTPLGARAPEQRGDHQIAMDASVIDKATQIAPGLANISTSL